MDRHISKRACAELITYALLFQFANDCQNASHAVPYKRGGGPGRKFLAMRTSMADQFKVQKEAPFLHIHTVHIRFTLCQACPYMVIVRTCDNLSRARTTSLKKVDKLNLSLILALSPPSYSCSTRSLAFLVC